MGRSRIYINYKKEKNKKDWFLGLHGRPAIVIIKPRALAIHPIKCRTLHIVSGPKWGSPSGDVTSVLEGAKGTIGLSLHNYHLQRPIRRN